MPVVWVGKGVGGGYQARGVLDSGTGLSIRPATAIQGEGAAYWTRRVSGYPTRRAVRMRKRAPFISPRIQRGARCGARPCLTRPHECFTQYREELAVRCLRGSALALGVCSAIIVVRVVCICSARYELFMPVAGRCFVVHCAKVGCLCGMLACRSMEMATPAWVIGGAPCERGGKGGGRGEKKRKGMGKRNRTPLARPVTAREQVG